ncbi:MAG: FGGY-family carbohydrate kinase [Oscillospiraceae bacterium]|jgi:sugar (pentulose or hexulose) kinase|nr:FGGY-family carbohydrate kinase [Oscillospiraceae bacterium]
MANDPLILTFDMGTQSARALLVDSRGTIVAKAQRVYDPPYYSLQPGWAEQRPEFYWDAVCACSRELQKQHGERWGDVIAVTTSTVRDTCVCLDKDRRPLRDIILWLDSRESSNDQLPRSQRIIAALLGKAETMRLQRRVGVCNWLAEHEPELWAKTDKYVLFSAWLTYRLCGNLIDAVPSTVGHVPFGYKSRTWLQPGDFTRPLFDVRDDQLYPLTESGAVFGTITKEAAAQTGIPEGLPLIATGSDKSCEVLGLGCLTPEKAALSFGTTATIAVTVPRYVEPLPFIPPYPSILHGHYTPEVEIYRGYWLISWFKREFAALETAQAEALGVTPEDLLNQHLREIPPGCQGLILHPYFTPGLIMPHARGSVIGFSDSHTRMHLYRAIIEGINFALMEGLQSVQKRSKQKTEGLFVAGGGSRSPEICQITANMFGLPLHRIHTHEVTGIGSSLVAFVAQGVFSSYQAGVDAMVHIQDAFQPDPAEHALYQTLYDQIYAEVFDRLEPLFCVMDGIMKK